ncbi:RHS repeat-associated core domain-containing protein [Burkholderia stabilis]|uniref:RHS repeat-associated core domain-containing protein n=1 Tax=Burkholderia stabilis TaxID=95485 RepID=A0A4Q2A9D3_9BURK|nr:RHS repeat-associated core domain-containing protein [Burkholderia stabilis]RXV65310.1 RHS repeat-associated core domain-containing protein [Burkholderia stabilis]
MKLQQQHDDVVTTALLATDQQCSVFRVRFNATQPDSISYTPYGHRALGSDFLGFNGEYIDPVTGHYLLGNGYRDFNPVLMRFHSPDGFSPFGKGGLNTYCYVGGDPVNFTDPTGASLFGAIGRFLRITKRVTTSSPSAKKIPTALKITPPANAKKVEKALHKITQQDIRNINKIDEFIRTGDLRLYNFSRWRDAENAKYALSNLGKPGITSASRAEMVNLIKIGSDNRRLRAIDAISPEILRAAKAKFKIYQI